MVTEGVAMAMAMAVAVAIVMVMAMLMVMAMVMVMVMVATVMTRGAGKNGDGDRRGWRAMLKIRMKLNLMKIRKGVEKSARKNVQRKIYGENNVHHMERMQCQEKATNSVQELVRTPINRPKHMFTQDGMPWVIPTWCTRENPVLGKQLFFFSAPFSACVSALWGCTLPF